ncbi:hypothetical protein CDAR_561821 [Caerostris darwini]|uniref:Uncharacterized protein n=1 Tax=Caerostris darwini TaxID=1538125 RepID=A0AAV4PEL4_9ARAC|nr:hypothetical protein CDAR_561821 [Caerostris darwini]
MKSKDVSSAKGKDIPACNATTGKTVGNAANIMTQGNAPQQLKNASTAANPMKLQELTTIQTIGHSTTNATSTKESLRDMFRSPKLH